MGWGPLLSRFQLQTHCMCLCYQGKKRFENEMWQKLLKRVQNDLKKTNGQRSRRIIHHNAFPLICSLLHFETSSKKLAETSIAPQKATAFVMTVRDKWKKRNLFQKHIIAEWHFYSFFLFVFSLPASSFNIFSGDVDSLSAGNAHTLSPYIWLTAKCLFVLFARRFHNEIISIFSWLQTFRFAMFSAFFSF